MWLVMERPQPAMALGCAGAQGGLEIGARLGAYLRGDQQEGMQ
jgi:hypothetical protein